MAKVLLVDHIAPEDLIEAVEFSTLSSINSWMESMREELQKAWEA